MRFDARALPVVGVLATWAGWPLQPAPRQPDRPHPGGGHIAGPTAGVVVIDGPVVHRIALTVAKLQGPR